MELLGDKYGKESCVETEVLGDTARKESLRYIGMWDSDMGKMT